MKPYNLAELETFFRQNNLFDVLGVEKIGVFGSFARNEPFQDIDLLIQDDVQISSLLAFHQKLTEKLDIPVDIVLEKYAEPIILLKAKRDLRYANRA